MTSKRKTARVADGPNAETKKAEKKPRTSPHKCYIGVSVCNLDDVLIGVWPHSPAGLRDAQKRCAEVAANPDLRLKQDHQSNDSGQIFVHLYSASGHNFSIVASFEPAIGVTIFDKDGNPPEVATG